MPAYLLIRGPTPGNQVDVEASEAQDRDQKHDDQGNQNKAGIG